MKGEIGEKLKTASWEQGADPVPSCTEHSRKCTTLARVQSDKSSTAKRQELSAKPFRVRGIHILQALWGDCVKSVSIFICQSSTDSPRSGPAGSLCVRLQQICPSLCNPTGKILIPRGDGSSEHGDVYPFPYLLNVSAGVNGFRTWLLSSSTGRPQVMKQQPLTVQAQAFTCSS